MQPIYGHISQETAFLIPDYPYGGKRCRIKFWLEQHPKRGFRFCSQTENPKTLRWNNPKQGTYYLMGANLYLDENDHLKCKALSEYSEPKEVLEFLNQFPNTVINLNLKAFILGKKQLAQRTSEGKANISIANVPQMPSEDDINKAKEELIIWDKCLKFIFH